MELAPAEELALAAERKGEHAPVVSVLPENESTVIHANSLER